MKAGVSAGSAALATEDGKHRANDAKCNELGWLCVPLVIRWGREAMEAFSQLASSRTTLTCRPKSATLFEMSGRLNLHLQKQCQALAGMIERCSACKGGCQGTRGSCRALPSTSGA